MIRPGQVNVQQLTDRPDWLSILTISSSWMETSTEANDLATEHLPGVVYDHNDYAPPGWIDGGPNKCRDVCDPSASKPAMITGCA